MRQREQSARLLHLEPSLGQTHPYRSRREPTGITTVALNRVSPFGINEASAIDALVDRIADRLAAAVVARLGSAPAREDEWLDSRQAAEYLGLHRDTLRRLAAARAIPSEQDGRGCKLFFRRVALDEWRRSGGRSRHLAAVASAA
jgi:excisionase family DNA binding protein